MRKLLQKLLIAAVGLFFSTNTVYSQQTIAQNDFEDQQTQPFITINRSSSGNITYFDYMIGTSPSNGTPASSPFNDQGGTKGIFYRGSSDGTRSYAYLHVAKINTAAYRNIELSVRVAAFGLVPGSGVTNNDYVKISMSTDGNNFVDKLKLTGHSSRAGWSFSGSTGVATHSYDQPMSTFAPAGGGLRTNDGYSTLKIKDIPPLGDLYVRIEMSSGYHTDAWALDNFIVTGTRTLAGTGNTFYGEESGGKVTSGLGNTFIGYKSGELVTSGLRNTFIGIEAGKVITTGGTNTMIGFNANATGTNASNLNNATAIGSDAKVSISNALILGNNANVGIGTSAPANKLEITSTVDNQSGLRFTKLKSNSQTSAANNVSLSVDANGDVILVPSALAASPWKTAAKNVSQTDTSQRIIIGAMPSTIPGNYKLYVSNGILAERVKVALKSSDKWSDYVFADNYTLRPLKDVEAYVKEHKHLPGVPSAQEVVDQGIDVAEMNAKLLEKIEELTLHMIRQEKIITHHQRELGRLKAKIRKQMSKK